jgi:cytochrome c553
MLMTKKDIREIRQEARDKKLAENLAEYQRISAEHKAARDKWLIEAPKIQAKNRVAAQKRSENKQTLEALRENTRNEKKAMGTIAQRQVLGKAFVLEYLKKNPCNHCGETNLMVLEFDHCSGSKDFNISTGLQLGFSVAVLRKEIEEKCQVLCGNCHSIKTQRERKTWRYQAVTSC